MYRLDVFTRHTVVALYKYIYRPSFLHLKHNLLLCPFQPVLCKYASYQILCPSLRSNE
jgi:hypothetical protein